jgi:hypothetical protein
VDLLLAEGFEVSLSVQEGNNLPGCRALVRGRWWVGVGPEPKLVVAARKVQQSAGSRVWPHGTLRPHRQNETTDPELDVLRPVDARFGARQRAPHHEILFFGR